MNAGDTGFMLTCAALVFFMTPGLAFFYGGLVRRKNVVNTMMAIVMIMGLAVVMWALFGFSLAFGGNHGVCLLIYSAYYTTKLVGKASAVTVVLRKISGQLFRKTPTGERSGSPVGVDDREIIWCGNRGCPACGGRSDWRRCSRPVCAAPRQRAGSCGRRPPPAPAPPG